VRWGYAADRQSRRGRHCSRPTRHRARTHCWVRLPSFHWRSGHDGRSAYRASSHLGVDGGKMELHYSAPEQFACVVHSRRRPLRTVAGGGLRWKTIAGPRYRYRNERRSEGRSNGTAPPFSPPAEPDAELLTTNWNRNDSLRLFHAEGVRRRPRPFAVVGSVLRGPVSRIMEGFRPMSGPHGRSTATRQTWSLNHGFASGAGLHGTDGATVELQ